MDSKLDEIRKRLEAATPGPWDIYFATGEGPCIVRYKEVGEYREIVEDVIPLYLRREKDEPNAQLIANAPSDLRFLLGLVEECREGMRRIAKLYGLWPPRATNIVYEPMQTYPLPAAKVAADWLEKVEGFKL